MTERRRFLGRGNPEYREWLVRHYACLNCGKRATDPAHVISKAKGGYDVGGTVAMCHECHNKQHAQGWDALEVSQTDAALQAIRCAVKYYEVTP